MKTNSTIIILSSAAMVLSGWLGPLWAQPPLERFEQQIRQRSVAADEDPAKAASGSARVGQGAGYLGLVADDKNDRGRGVRVLEVQRGSPAEKAGIRQHDLIVGMIGVRVRQMSDLSEMLESFQPGDQVDFEVLRDGVKQEIRVVLTKRPSASETSKAPEMVPLPQGEPMVEPPPSVADDDRVGQLERRVGELERQVAELQQALKTLKEPQAN